MWDTHPPAGSRPVLKRPRVQVEGSSEAPSSPNIVPGTSGSDHEASPEGCAWAGSWGLRQSRAGQALFEAAKDRKEPECLSRITLGVSPSSMAPVGRRLPWDSTEPHSWLVTQQPPEGAFFSVGLNKALQTEMRRSWGLESHRTPWGNSIPPLLLGLCPYCLD